MDDKQNNLRLPLKRISYFLFVLLLALSVMQFHRKRPGSDAVSLNFKWYQSYSGQSWSSVRTGMLWSFSYLGALLPKNSFEKSLTFADSSTFRIDLNLLGFNEKALAALAVICDSIKKSDEYRRNQFIDLSRFFALTLHSTFHYYKITGAEPDYRNFVRRYRLEQPILFGVTNSAVSKGHRLIKFTNDTALFSMGFVAEEGHGSLVNEDFAPRVFETFDFMPNGQARYAIYDEAGRLTDESSKEFSTAGKPAKCMWCHELYIQPLYAENTAVKNMLSNSDFVEKVRVLQEKLNSYRKALSTDINFENKQDHTAGELLYISFMEPSLHRLRVEFGGDSTVLKKIITTPSHVYQEFPFLGELYHRKNIDSLFAYQRLIVPEFVREKSSYEPNYLDTKKQ